MKTFLRCKRKWWLSEYRKLAPNGYDPSGPLRSGSRVHVALEALYTGSDALDTLRGAQDADWQTYLKNLASLGFEPDPATAAEFQKDCELERIMVEGYLEWIAETGADAGLEVVATEQVVAVPASRFTELRTPDGDDFLVVGKLDMRLRRAMDGARLFLDHKTARSLTDIVPTLRQDPQMLHYHWLEAMTTDGAWCDGALYNVLKKVKRSKNAKPPFYARYEVHHNADELAAYELRMTRIIEAIFELETQLREADQAPAHRLAQIAYPTVTRDCAWDCPFVNVCPMFDDGSRAEAALAEDFYERNPLARYDEPAKEPV